MAERNYRVTIQYTFAKKRGGVSLGMTIRARDEEDAIERAKAEHIAPYRSRRFHAAMAKRAKP